MAFPGPRHKNTTMLFIIAVSWLCTLLSGVLVNGHQEFAAVAKHASLKRSSSGLEPSRALQRLVYHHESNGREMAASIVLEPNMPMLIHEDFDHYIAKISCDAEKMRVKFFNDSLLDHAASVWTHKPFVIVTHEAECQEVANEHAAWIVAYDSTDEDKHLITLNATKADLKDVTVQMFVELGDHLVSHVDRQELRRRQVVTVTSTTTVGTTTTLQGGTLSLPSSPSSSITVSVPTSSATQLSNTGDLTFAHRGLVILPPESSIAAAVLPPTLQNVKITCLTCSMDGLVTLTAVNFSISSTSPYLTAQNFLNNGGVKFETSNFATTMSLEIQLLAGWRASKGLVSLPRKMLGSIGIAGVITFSPVMDFSIPLSLTLNSPVTLRAGFNVPQSPPGTANINIGSPTKSSATGFNNTINPLPFSVDAPNLSFNISLALQPKLSLMMGLTPSAKSNLGSKSAVNGSVGLYFDTPILNARISALNNVNDQCQPDSSRTNTYIRVEPDVQFDFGTFYQFDANLGTLSLPTISKNQNVSAVLWSRALPSSCLKWSESSRSFGSDANGAAPGSKISIGRPLMAAIMTLVVCFVFLGL